jgi:hypothetical protein
MSRASVIVAALLTLASMPSAAHAAGSPPNIVLILTDDK